MAQEVTKRDGSTEPFDAEKIRRSIKTAAEEAGLAADRIAEVVEKVGGSVIDFAKSKAEVTTAEIRDRILSELDAVESAVSAAWRTYDKERSES